MSDLACYRQLKQSGICPSSGSWIRGIELSSHEIESKVIGSVCDISLTQFRSEMTLERREANRSSVIWKSALDYWGRVTSQRVGSVQQSVFINLSLNGVENGAVRNHEYLIP
jgi:hypothetical protein